MRLLHDFRLGLLGLTLGLNQLGDQLLLVSGYRGVSLHHLGGWLLESAVDNVFLGVGCVLRRGNGKGVMGRRGRVLVVLDRGRGGLQLVVRR